MNKTIRASDVDYLIIGGGGMGMAFADTILTETDATIAIVDRYHRPGGHWNYAYPFVRLHQPSAYYGVNSKELGSNQIDKVGWNKGLYELASSAEVLAYFDQVMREQFLPSGRVQYFPMCEYIGEGRFTSRLTDSDYSIAAKKNVDTTYMDVRVPAVFKPSFAVEGGVTCLPPNELAGPNVSYKRYVIIGGGKTGIDTCLFLLSNGVDPDSITWIIPRDGWLMDRVHFQPDDDAVMANFASQASAIVESTSVADMFDRLVACGQLLQLADDVRPTMFRCATVTKAEQTELRRIKNIVRMGRIKKIDDSFIHLEGGKLETCLDAIHINCTADGLAKKPSVPVFQENKIVLQSVRPCQQVFSAALIAHVEATSVDDEEKNKICVPTPHPNSELDYLRFSMAIMESQLRWVQNFEILDWLTNARLDGITPANLPALLDPKNGSHGEEFLTLMRSAINKLRDYLNDPDNS